MQNLEKHQISELYSCTSGHLFSIFKTNKKKSEITMARLNSDDYMLGG